LATVFLWGITCFSSPREWRLSPSRSPKNLMSWCRPTLWMKVPPYCTLMSSEVQLVCVFNLKGLTWDHGLRLCPVNCCSREVMQWSVPNKFEMCWLYPAWLRVYHRSDIWNSVWLSCKAAICELAGG